MSLTRRNIPWLQRHRSLPDTACAASYPQSVVREILKIYRCLGAVMANPVLGGWGGLQARTGAGEARE